MDALSQVRKIFSEETDYNSPVTAKLFTDIAGALNAFCNFADGKCTHFEENGTYTTSPNSSLVIAMSRGGSGGQGGGATGAVLQYNGTETSDYLYRFQVHEFGNEGNQGGQGGSSFFGLDQIAEGGQGGLGGNRVPPVTLINEVNTNSFTIEGDGVRPQLERFIGQMGSGGNIIGGMNGQLSFIAPGAPVGLDTESDILAGLSGYMGQPGNYGFRVIKAVPSTSYAIQVGAGGSGGLGGAAYTGNFNGGSVNMLAGGDGLEGSDGYVTIYEFGF